MTKEIKIRYSNDELKVLEEKAKKEGKSLEEYQKNISEKAEVKIMVNE